LSIQYKKIENEILNLKLNIMNLTKQLKQTKKVLIIKKT